MQALKVYRFLIGGVLACALNAVPVVAHAEGSFTVLNNSDQKIKELLVSPDKKKWGYFDIGKGISAGKSVDVKWNRRGDNLPCKLWAKAVYADGSESDAEKYDFCEDDLEVEFDD